MSEVDIWINVIDKLGFKFIDEYCGAGDVNHIKYQDGKDIYSLSPEADTNWVFHGSIKKITKR